MQAFVGGPIETFPLGFYLIMWNEEGRLRGLPATFRVRRPAPICGAETIVGTVFVTKPEGEDFASLSDAEVSRICEAFRHDPVPQLDGEDEAEDTSRRQIGDDAGNSHDLR